MNITEIRIAAWLQVEGGSWRTLVTPERWRYTDEEFLFGLLRNQAVHALKTDDGRIFDIKNGWRPFEKPQAFPPEAVHTTADHRELDPEADGKNLLAARLIDAWCADKGHQIPWNKAIDIVAIVTGMDEEKVKELKAL